MVSQRQTKNKRRSAHAANITYLAGQASAYAPASSQASWLVSILCSEAFLANLYSFDIANPVAGGDMRRFFISRASIFSVDRLAEVLNRLLKLPLLLEPFVCVIVGNLFLLSFLGASVGFKAWFLSTGGGPCIAGIGGGKGEGGIGGASSSIRSACPRAQDITDLNLGRLFRELMDEGRIRGVVGASLLVQLQRSAAALPSNRCLPGEPGGV